MTLVVWGALQWEDKIYVIRALNNILDWGIPKLIHLTPLKSKVVLNMFQIGIWGLK